MHFRFELAKRFQVIVEQLSIFNPEEPKFVTKTKIRIGISKGYRHSYQAATLAETEVALDTFVVKWDEHYPAISQIWPRH
jgi:hypothetical protein